MRAIPSLGLHTGFVRSSFGIKRTLLFLFSLFQLFVPMLLQFSWIFFFFFFPQFSELGGQIILNFMARDFSVQWQSSLDMKPQRETLKKPKIYTFTV